MGTDNGIITISIPQFYTTYPCANSPEWPPNTVAVSSKSTKKTNYATPPWLKMKQQPSNHPQYVPSANPKDSDSWRKNMDYNADPITGLKKSPVQSDKCLWAPPPPPPPPHGPRVYTGTLTIGGTPFILVSMWMNFFTSENPMRWSNSSSHISPQISSSSRKAVHTGSWKPNLISTQTWTETNNYKCDNHNSHNRPPNDLYLE